MVRALLTALARHEIRLSFVVRFGDCVEFVAETVNVNLGILPARGGKDGCVTKEMGYMEAPPPQRELVNIQDIFRRLVCRLHC